MNDGAALMRNLLVWGVPFAAVAALLAYETNWGRDIAGEFSSADLPAPQPVAVSLLPEYRVDGGAEARKETVDRELFNPTRRPGPPAAEGAAPSNVKHGLYLLTGTTVIGNVATAFLREVNGGKSHTVHAGESLNGVTVAEVKPDRVRLRQGDDVEELQLKIAAGPKVTTQVAAPPVGVAGQPVPQPVGVAPGPATPARGGSNRAARPVPPPAAAPVAAPGTPGTVSVGELLAQRRRAARAAAQAGAAGQPVPATP